MPLKSELQNDQGLVAMGLRRWKAMGLAFTVVVATGAVAVQPATKLAAKLTERHFAHVSIGLAPFLNDAHGPRIGIGSFQRPTLLAGLRLKNGG